jgi:hypothetical protein
VHDLAVRDLAARPPFPATWPRFLRPGNAAAAKFRSAVGDFKGLLPVVGDLRCPLLCPLCC